MSTVNTKYPFTSPKQSAERLAIVKMDAVIALIVSALVKLNTNASGLLDLTSDITLSAAPGRTNRNTNTFTVHVLAAAANPTNTVLASFSGSSSAISLSITPNSGANNGAVPVNLSTLQLAELINNGSVAGKNITLSDAYSLRALQTASGGGAALLAHSGEGDGTIATFSGGNYSFTDLAASLVTMQAACGVRDEDFRI